jgi:hypothetical protein
MMSILTRNAVIKNARNVRKRIIANHARNKLSKIKRKKRKNRRKHAKPVKLAKKKINHANLNARKTKVYNT